MSFSTGNSSQQSEINVTPLIDVLLVLLIIFMILVPQASNGLKALVPQPPPKSSVPPSPDPATIVVQVHSGDGGVVSYSINQQPVAKSEMVALLSAIFINRAQKVMFVKGDPDLQFDSIAEVIGLGRQAMVTDIGVLTPRAERGE
jgi:biopolymer transport protein TolR